MIPQFNPNLRQPLPLLAQNPQEKEDAYLPNIQFNCFEDFETFYQSKLESLDLPNPTEKTKFQSLDEFLNFHTAAMLASFNLSDQFKALKLLLILKERMEEFFVQTLFFSSSLGEFPGFTFSLKAIQNDQKIIGININDQLINANEQFFLEQVKKIQDHISEEEFFISFNVTQSQIPTREFLTLYGESVKELSFSGSNQELLNQFFNNFPRLNKVDIENSGAIENIILTHLKELNSFTYKEYGEISKTPTFHWSDSLITLDLSFKHEYALKIAPPHLVDLRLKGPVKSITAPLLNLKYFKGHKLYLKKLPVFSSNLKQLELNSCYNFKSLNNIPTSVESLCITYSEYLNNIEIFSTSLKKFVICGCWNLKKISSFPPTLEELRIEDLLEIEEFPAYPENLKKLYFGTHIPFAKLPKTLPKNLKSFEYFKHCLEDKSFRKHLLESTLLLKKRFTFQLLNNVFTLFQNKKIKKTDYEKFITLLVEKLPAPFILNSIEKIKRVVSPECLNLFYLKSWNEDPFEFIQFLSILRLPSKVLLEITAKSNSNVALEIVSKGLNFSKINQIMQERLSKKETIIPTEYDAVNIEEIFEELFNQINFLCPDKPHYFVPTRLQNRQTDLSPEYFKEGLFKLASNIKEKKTYTGVPVEEKLKEQYYKTVENQLKQFLALAKNAFFNKEDLDLFLTARRELINIAIAGHYCGARWLNDPKEAVKVMTGNLIQDGALSGVEELFEKWFREDLFLQIENVKNYFTQQLGFSAEIHIHNQVGRLLSNSGILFEEGTFQLDDPINLIPNDLLMNEIANTFFSPLRIIRQIWNRSLHFLKKESTRAHDKEDLGEGSHLLESFMEVMRDVAKETLVHEISVIENELPDRAFIKGKEILRKKLEALKQSADKLEKKIETKKGTGKDEDVEMPLNTSNDNKLLQKEGEKKFEKEIQSLKRKRSFEEDENPLLKKQKIEGTTFEKTREKLFFKLRKKEEKLIYFKQKIMKYEKILENEDFFEENLRSIGIESARSSILIEKELLLDTALEKEGLFFYDSETIEMNISIKGVYFALKHLGFLV